MWQKPHASHLSRFATLIYRAALHYVIHVAVAALVAYAVTGSLIASLTLSLLEPTVQAFAFFFHEKAWQRWNARRMTAESPQLAS